MFSLNGELSCTIRILINILFLISQDGFGIIHWRKCSIIYTDILTTLTTKANRNYTANSTSTSMSNYTHICYVLLKSSCVFLLQWKLSFATLLFCRHLSCDHILRFKWWILNCDPPVICDQNYWSITPNSSSSKRPHEDSLAHEETTLYMQ